MSVYARPVLRFFEADQMRLEHQLNLSQNELNKNLSPRAFFAVNNEKQRIERELKTVKNLKGFLVAFSGGVL